MRFLMRFALANVGAVLAYLPFLSLLLPLKVEALAGTDRVTVMSIVLGGGAIAAGASNILVGLAIDRSMARGGELRAWIAMGMVTTALSFVLVLAAHSPPALCGAVIAFELAVNVLIAPVAMVLVDEVPDAQKGLAGGLLTLGQPLAMLAGTGLVPLYERSDAGAYGAICLGMVLLGLPILIMRAPAPLLAAVAEPVAMGRPDLAWLIVSRLLLLTANCILGVILVYYFEALLPGLSPGAVARRVGVVGVTAYALAAPIAVMLGATAVNRARRRALAIGAALVSGGAVVMIALSPHWQWAAIGYALFVCTIQVYTSQQSALVAQGLRKPRHRARDLGFQNLANTAPAVIAPMIVVAVYRYATLPALIWTMAALSLASAIALARVAAD